MGHGNDSHLPPVPKIILDAPAVHPSLGYEGIAEALTAIIETSEPRFAIGIFGGWGSGKTTLMNAIETGLSRDRTIAVPFNAWRFERETHLLVPLLDAVRESLLTWAKDREGEIAKRAKTAARRIAKVVRALVMGLSVDVGLPGAEVGFEAAKAVEALGDTEDAPAQSLYFAGYKELADAFAEFTKGGITRVVVFVDDLDRCLPQNALSLLESMKLFFDLPGFVFVVGLDDKVVERAVMTKFEEGRGLERPSATDGERTAASKGCAATSAPPGRAEQRLGREYIKKLFQVPYALPAMAAGQLDELLNSMYQEAELDDAQLDDLRGRVRRYLGYVAVDGRINPREIKRFINAYTLQTLVRPVLDANILLAIQTVAFRADWETAYDAILADSAFFVDALRRYREGDEQAIEDLWPRPEPPPADFTAYMRSPAAEPLVELDSLDDYTFSLQSTSSTQTWVIEAYRDLGQLRHLMRKARATGDNGQTNLVATELLEVLGKLGHYYPSILGPAEGQRFARLVDPMREAADNLRKATAGEIGGSRRSEWADKAVEELADRVARLLTELRALRDASVLASA
jgi:hypothetical protein